MHDTRAIKIHASGSICGTESFEFLKHSSARTQHAAAVKVAKTEMCGGRAQLLALAAVATTQAFSLIPRTTPRTRLRAAAVEEFDVVVIGSGIGGLSCASLLAAAGR